MTKELPDLLPTRLNHDAVIFLGCTAKELQWIGLISLGLCLLVLGLFTQLLCGMFLIGVGLAFPSSVGVCCIFAAMVQKAKQGKPKGYVKQWLLIEAEKLGIMRSGYVRRSGYWSLGRRT